MLKAIFFRCFDVNTLKYKTTQAKQKKISIYKCYTCNVNLHDRHIKSIQYLYYILFVNVYNIFHFLCLQYKFTLQITYKGTILNFYPSTTTKNKQYFSGTNFFFFFFGGTGANYLAKRKMAEAMATRRAVVLSLSKAAVEEVSSRLCQKSNFICRLWCLDRRTTFWFGRCIPNWVFLFIYCLIV